MVHSASSSALSEPSLTCVCQDCFTPTLVFLTVQLYSSGLVECEPHETDNPARNFAVQSVKKEIRRGRRLVSWHVLLFINLECYIQRTVCHGCGHMVQQFRMLATHPEVLSLVPNTRWQLRTACNSSPRASDTHCWPPQTHALAYLSSQTQK